MARRKRKDSDLRNATPKTICYQAFVEAEIGEGYHPNDTFEAYFERRIDRSKRILATTALMTPPFSSRGGKGTAIILEEERVLNTVTRALAAYRKAKEAPYGETYMERVTTNDEEKEHRTEGYAHTDGDILSMALSCWALSKWHHAGMKILFIEPWVHQVLSIMPIVTDVSFTLPYSAFSVVLLDDDKGALREEFLVTETAEFFLFGGAHRVSFSDAKADKAVIDRISFFYKEGLSTEDFMLCPKHIRFLVNLVVALNSTQFVDREDYVAPKRGHRREREAQRVGKTFQSYSLIRLNPYRQTKIRAQYRPPRKKTKGPSQAILERVEVGNHWRTYWVLEENIKNRPVIQKGKNSKAGNPLFRVLEFITRYEYGEGPARQHISLVRGTDEGCEEEE